MIGLSIIIPVLDEGAGIEVALKRLARLVEQATEVIEVIVVDGGSRDDTVARTEAIGMAEFSGAKNFRVIAAPRGRGSQMNAGAVIASGITLLFLHVDTVLPPEAPNEIARGLATGHDWGRFDVRIESAIGSGSAGLVVVAAMMNWRSRLTGIATGDQAIFVRREAFDAAGGFPDIPLMEDLALSTALRQSGCPYCSRAKVITSGRRWEKHGLLTTIRRMWWLRLRYFFGAHPATLALAYGYRPRIEQLPDAAGSVRPVAIVILAKAPVPGLAKTRLIPLLGPGGAAQLQAWMIRRAVRTALAAGLGPVTLWCMPDDQHPEFLACANAPENAGRLTLRVQPAGDLGERMLAAVATEPGVAGTLIIGTDCPLMTAATLQAAAQILREGDDAVVVPAEDGGYVLIGLTRPVPEVFAGVAWGSAEVMASTRQRLDAAGLRWRKLPTHWDVDLPADVERLRVVLPEARNL